MLAIVGNKAVIAQVKSKRLTEVAKIGNETRLGADFKLAVQEAYDQALLCRRALLDRDSNLLVGGKEIHLGESIDDAYILCVTLDHYPAVMHQVDVYLAKKPDDRYQTPQEVMRALLPFLKPEMRESAAGAAWPRRQRRRAE